MTASVPTATDPLSALSRLEATVRDRLNAADGAASYVAALAAKGDAAIARKLGEEALEVVIAALDGEPSDIVAEAADLAFHLTILLGHHRLGWGHIAAELDRRAGVSGLVEKAARTAGPTS